MSVHIPAAAFSDASLPHAAVRPNRLPRTFDLHPAIFIGLFGTFTAFLLVMAAAFMTKELWIPFAIFFVYLGMYFGVPALWVRASRAEEGPRQTWAEFMDEGVDTATGHMTASTALAQIFVLPALLLCWALAVVTISAMAF